MRLRTRSAAETRALAEDLAELLGPGDLVVLAGDLGSGKTVFAQGLAAGLGVRERVVSPTFTIVCEYSGRLPLAHVDVYRLRHLQELHDLGFDELVDDGRVTVVEWGDLVEPVLPDERLVVRLEPGDDDEERHVTVTAHGGGWRSRADRLCSLVARHGGS